MTEQKNRTYTYPEYLLRFSSNQILSRMERSLCDYLGLDRPWQSRFSPTTQDPRCGIVEVAQSSWRDSKQIREWLESFYEGEGYTITRKEPHENSLIVKNDKNECFVVIVAATDSSFIISIFHSL